MKDWFITITGVAGPGLFFWHLCNDWYWSRIFSKLNDLSEGDVNQIDREATFRVGPDTLVLMNDGIFWSRLCVFHQGQRVLGLKKPKEIIAWATAIKRQSRTES
jgi:hypothetical protein